ncbi:hypothetical protein H257_11281 [Aphanomyces astaci]|uniref:Uncharacterized protein n=1 Tax=Aphanomyces astaci TaxID=112090 RepID=W4G2Q1_APHAT|nr:hypothetical protein H257_11281 [Aphanomyces astaci]ETV73965.1 hypothetical protein H257_11281 [Aphanomyces astaci]|eukprot:XP_009836478.1 hypothetical protein H257_11281 [Aphanomyces astaci]
MHENTPNVPSATPSPLNYWWVNQRQFATSKLHCPKGKLTCASKDFGTRADQAKVSKAKKVVLALLPCSNVLNQQVVSMDVPARIVLFQGCLAALCQRHLALSDQAAVAKRRVSEMSYHSMYDIINK